MLTEEQRKQIVTEAMTWVKAKTPYQGHSRKKGVGCDCGQLLYSVYNALDLLPEVDLPKDYRLDVSQHQASTAYVDLVATYFDEIREQEALPGDLVVYKLGLAYAHGAIIVRWPDQIIDAELHGGVKVRHGTNKPAFRMAARKFFRLKEHK
jgi:cell wall-associated NlpC family hydrolase